MAIKVATGLQGHGKTYETVVHAICPAIDQGRRVVTNVAGLNYEKILAHVRPAPDPQGGPVAPATGEAVSVPGVIVTVTRKQIEAEDFFPRLDEFGHYDPTFESVVLPGDLVVLDEAWAIWGDAKSVKPYHMAWLREHRHFTHPETGVASDLVLITQDIGDLARSVLRVVEMTTLCYKPKEIGITSAYVVDLYQGAKLHKTKRISTHRYFYKKSVFELYRSYSGKKANEVGVDGRQNMLAGAAFRMRIGVAFLVIAGSVFWGWRFFHPAAAPTGPVVEAPKAAQPVPAMLSAPPSPAASKVSAKSRNVGFVRIGGRLLFVVETEGGKFRYVENPDSFMINSHTSNVQIDGETLTQWSGGRSSGGGLFGGFGK